MTPNVADFCVIDSPYGARLECPECGDYFAVNDSDDGWPTIRDFISAASAHSLMSHARATTTV